MSERHEDAYEVAAGARAIYVRVHGLASMNNCLCLRDFIEEMFAACHTFLIIDLADCIGMDSTFMGLIAATAQFRKDDRPAGVAVVNASERLTELLESVGITELVFVDPDQHEVPELEFVKLQEPVGEEERLSLIHWAHIHLMKLSERNEQLFGPYLAALEADIRAHDANAM